MDYTLALCLEKLPGAVIRKAVVDGVEQQGVFIPLDHRVFHTTKKGWRFVQVNLYEHDEPRGTETHYATFSFPDPAMKDRMKKDMKCGRLRISLDDSMKQDRTVTTEFVGYGVISLDDIPEDAVSTSRGKRYLRVVIQPMAEKDRAGNDLVIVVDSRYGADKGRRESLQNGFDAPLVEVGRATAYDKDQAVPDEQGYSDGAAPEEAPAEPEEGKTIDGLAF